MAARTVDVEARTASVMEAAATIFAQRGYNAATIEEIAHAAGIGKGTTYEYFPSKQELFLAVIDHDWRRLVEAHDEPSGGPDRTTMDRLDALTTAVLESYQEIQRLHPAAMEFLVSSGAPDCCRRLMRSFRDGLAIFRDRAAHIIDAGMARGEVRGDLPTQVIATVLIGALEGLVLQGRTDPSLRPQELWKPFLSVVARGMEPRSALAP
jgi:AcrR family transcriptional regulator